MRQAAAAKQRYGQRLLSLQKRSSVVFGSLQLCAGGGHGTIGTIAILALTCTTAS